MFFCIHDDCLYNSFKSFKTKNQLEKHYQEHLKEVKSVACFLTDIDEKILILRDKKGKYSNAGGHIDIRDGNPFESMIRELKEETNIDYCQLKIIKETSWIYINTQIFILKVEEIPDNTKKSIEHTALRIVNLNDIHHYPLKGYFKNSLVNNLRLLFKD